MDAKRHLRRVDGTPECDHGSRAYPEMTSVRATAVSKEDPGTATQNALQASFDLIFLELMMQKHTFSEVKRQVWTWVRTCVGRLVARRSPVESRDEIMP